MTIALSKSRHVAGLQCPLLLWTQVHRRDRIPPPDAATQRVFDTGHEVGRMAQRIAPGGVEVPFGSMQSTVRATRELLPRRIPIYEASFVGGGVYCRVDVLRPAGETGWDLLEVKSTTRVKDVHLDDIAIQDHGLRAAGIDVRRLYLVHLDRGYRREGALDPQRLFHAEDVTERARARREDVQEAIARAFRVIEGDEPRVPIGPHCDEPYECALKSSCWAHVPDDAVTTLARAGRRAFQWMDRGWMEAVDVPESELSDAQRVQQRALREGRVHVDTDRVRAWLDGLTYPLSLLDFEAFAPAIPVLEGTGPFQAIPFQVSVHRLASPGAEPEHVDFLATEPGDPRPALVEFLSRLPREGSVVAWHASYERKVLEELAAEFPARASTLWSLVRRTVDLEEPFRRFAIHHPAQRGSTSIKAVLPAFTGKGYRGDPIGGGEQAASEYLRAMYGDVDPHERIRVLDALRAYCAKDTHSMVELLRALVDAVNGSDGRRP